VYWKIEKMGRSADYGILSDRDKQVYTEAKKQWIKFIQNWGMARIDGL